GTGNQAMVELAWTSHTGSWNRTMMPTDKIHQTKIQYLNPRRSRNITAFVQSTMRFNQYMNWNLALDIVVLGHLLNVADHFLNLAGSRRLGNCNISRTVANTLDDDIHILLPV